jgi:transposase InsO family protein
MKDLEKEDLRLRRAISDLTLDKLILQEAARENFIFYSLAEARVLIEAWRRYYNTVRPHSSLGYRPPAPGAARRQCTNYADHPVGAAHCRLPRRSTIRFSGRV